MAEKPPQFFQPDESAAQGPGHPWQSDQSPEEKERDIPDFVAVRTGQAAKDVAAATARQQEQAQQMTQRIEGEATEADQEPTATADRPAEAEAATEDEGAPPPRTRRQQEQRDEAARRWAEGEPPGAGIPIRDWRREAMPPVTAMATEPPPISPEEMAIRRQLMNEYRRRNISGAEILTGEPRERIVIPSALRREQWANFFSGEVHNRVLRAQQEMFLGRTTPDQVAAGFSDANLRALYFSNPDRIQTEEDLLQISVALREMVHQMVVEGNPEFATEAPAWEDESLSQKERDLALFTYIQSDAIRSPSVRGHLKEVIRVKLDVDAHLRGEIQADDDPLIELRLAEFEHLTGQPEEPKNWWERIEGYWDRRRWQIQAENLRTPDYRAMIHEGLATPERRRYLREALERDLATLATEVEQRPAQQLDVSVLTGQERQPRPAAQVTITEQAEVESAQGARAAGQAEIQEGSEGGAEQEPTPAEKLQEMLAFLATDEGLAELVKAFAEALEAEDLDDQEALSKKLGDLSGIRAPGALRWVAGQGLRLSRGGVEAGQVTAASVIAAIIFLLRDLLGALMEKK